MHRADSFHRTDLEAALPRLRRYARILVGGPDGADELVAQTLAGVPRRPPAPLPERDFLTWLFGLMRDAYKREPSRPPQPCDRQSESGSDICTRVMQLPIDEREVLMLVAVERLSYAEVARLLGVPIPAVLTTLTRARERLCAMPSNGID